MGIQRILCGALFATCVTSVDGHFHVSSLNVVEDMVLLSASVLTDQADKFCGRQFVYVLQQLLPQAWGASVVYIFNKSIHLWLKPNFISQTQCLFRDLWILSAFLVLQIFEHTGQK